MRIIVPALVAFLFLSTAALAQAPVPAPAAAPAAAVRPVPDFSPAPVADAALEARIRGLIMTVEDKPSGVVINNRGRVDAPPRNQPYNPDGSRNENFRVTADYTGDQAFLLLSDDARRNAAINELIRIGRPAAPFLAMAAVYEPYEQRALYVKALGEIRDPRAVPHLLKYLEDGKMKLALSATVARQGDAAMSQKLLADGNRMMADASEALAKITGQNYGTNLALWEKWWEDNRAKVGPVPPVQLYQVGTTTAPPPGPARPAAPAAQPVTPAPVPQPAAPPPAAPAPAQPPKP